MAHSRRGDATRHTLALDQSRREPRGVGVGGNAQRKHECKQWVRACARVRIETPLVLANKSPIRRSKLSPARQLSSSGRLFWRTGCIALRSEHARCQLLRVMPSNGEFKQNVARLHLAERSTPLEVERVQPGRHPNRGAGRGGARGLISRGRPLYVESEQRRLIESVWIGTGARA